MILSVCEEPSIMNVMYYVILMIKILRAAIPIILIITVMLKFASAVTKHDEAAIKKVTSSVVQNLVAAVLIFLVPTFVDIVVKLSFPNSDYTNCISGITLDTVNAAFNAKMDKLISEAESSLEYSDYSSALTYLSNIKDSTKKQEYEAKLNTIKELIDNKEAESKPSTPSTPITGGSCEYKIESGKTKVTVGNTEGALSYTYQYGSNRVDSTSNTYVINGEYNDVVVVIRGKEEDKVIICTKTSTGGSGTDDVTPGQFIIDPGSTSGCNKNGKYKWCAPTRGAFGSFPYYDSEPDSTKNRWSLEMDPKWAKENFVTITKTCSNGWQLNFQMHVRAKSTWEKVQDKLCQITTTGITNQVNFILVALKHQQLLDS